MVTHTIGRLAEKLRNMYAYHLPMSASSKAPKTCRMRMLLFISYPTPATWVLILQYSTRDTVAVWGCGAVGLFAMISAYMMGAGGKLLH